MQLCHGFSHTEARGSDSMKKWCQAIQFVTITAQATPQDNLRLEMRDWRDGFVDGLEVFPTGNVLLWRSWDVGWFQVSWLELVVQERNEVVVLSACVVL